MRANFTPMCENPTLGSNVYASNEAINFRFTLFAVTTSTYYTSGEIISFRLGVILLKILKLETDRSVELADGPLALFGPMVQLK